MIRQLKSSIVYQNKWMTVREDEVEFANKKTGIYGVVEKPDFAMIVPYDSGSFYLVKQYRYPVKGAFWEFPQGSYEKKGSIDPLELARNELKEETGCLAKEIKEIGYLYEAYGYCNQGFHIFLATGLTEGAQNLEESEQGLIVKRVSVSEFVSMVEKGDIKDAPTLSAYGLLKIKNLV